MNRNINACVSVTGVIDPFQLDERRRFGFEVPQAWKNCPVLTES
jgi:hypothetical protein